MIGYPASPKNKYHNKITVDEMIISFTIPLNPVPYLRMTQREVHLLRIPRHKVNCRNIKKYDAIIRYLGYKKDVWTFLPLTFMDLDQSKKIYMRCYFYFSSGKHGDPDNCWKAVADAIFKNDNKVVGEFDFGICPDRPRTEVEIEEV